MDGDGGVAPHVSQQVHLQGEVRDDNHFFMDPFSRWTSRYLVAVHELADTDLVLVVFHVKLDILVPSPFLV